MKKLLFLFLFIPTILYAQNAQNKSAFKRYIDFLKPDETTACHLMYAGVHLQYVIPGDISNTGHGIMVPGLGINIARAFTKKIHLGLYGTFKPRGLIMAGTINPDFASALNSNANYDNLNHNDSIVASYFVNSSSQKRSLGGSGRYQYGICFYLPIKYFPLIKIYKGSTIELVDIGSNYTVQQIVGNSDWTYFHYNTYGMELTLIYNYKYKNNWNQTIFPFSVAVFCEKNRINSSDVNGIKLNSFLNDSFFDQYANSYRFGIKVGLEIW